MDTFQSEPTQNSIDMSVYVKPGIAQEPLNCAIKLTGIDPERTIYINRQLPLSPRVRRWLLGKYSVK